MDPRKHAGTHLPTHMSLKRTFEKTNLILDFVHNEMGNESSSKKRFSKKGSTNHSSATSSSYAPINVPLPKGATKAGHTGFSEIDADAAQQTLLEGQEDVSPLQLQFEQLVEKKKVSMEDFQLLKTIGKGSFGKVIQVKKTSDGKIYAMKVLNKEAIIKSKEYERTMAERRILEEVDHPFIVSLRFAFQSTTKLYLVFDFFNGGELFHYLSKGSPFPEERARLYAAEITLALGHIHAMNIIYRDLKPENLLLDADGHIRVADFGLSKENVVGDDVKSICGTPEYLAPEVIKGQKYGKAVDWWSLGTLIYEMISGLPPFYDKSRDRMYKKIIEAELRFPQCMSTETRSICRGLLNRDADQRLGYNGVQEVKAHNFFAPLNFDDVLARKVEPPFKPNVANEEDTRNVASTFTSIPAAISPTPGDSVLANIPDGSFDDFTYVQKTAISGTEFDELVPISE